jgi:hypothetical protein
MGLDGYCFLFGLMVIPFSFLFVPKVYFNKRLVLPFYIFALTLATIGLFAPKNTVETKPNFYLFLLCPLFSLTILRVQLFIFNKTLKRNPKNPPRNFFMNEDGLGWDRLFYFVFMMLSLVLPIGLLAHFYG